jgi:hypothetical protein
MHDRASGARAYIEPPTKLARAGSHSRDTHTETWRLVLIGAPIAWDTLTVVGYDQVQALADAAQFDRDA